VTLLQRIEDLIEFTDLTLTQIEKDCGFSKSSMRKWSDNFPSADKVIKVAQYLNVSTDYLFGLTDYKNVTDQALIKSSTLDSAFEGLSYSSRETITQIFKKLISCTKDYEDLNSKKYVNPGVGAGKYLLNTIGRNIEAYQSAVNYLNGNQNLSSTIYKLDEMLRGADQSLNFVRELVEKFESDNKSSRESYDNIIYLRHAIQPVSAGTGTYVTEECMEKMKVMFNKQTARADFCVTVSGDSMEPKFHDGEILLVHEQPDIEHGEFGIFVINDEGFVKQRGEKELISLNPNYENIPFCPDDDILCGGKVIGILNQDSILLQ